MSEEDNDEFNVDELVSELKKVKKDGNRRIATADTLKKDEAEKFILDNAAGIVRTAMETLSEVQQRVASGGSAEEIESFAKLMTATTSALDTLGRLVKTDKDNETKVVTSKINAEARQLELQKKEGNDADSGQTVKINREDLYRIVRDAATKKLPDKGSEPIDVT